MAELGRDPRYRALATSAASILGSSNPSIIAAILAQWTCEQPSGPPWPPVHNNPGFVTIGALRSNGIALGVYATRKPGIHFLASFRSPSEGATAYAELLRRGKRWAPARAEIARGRGDRFLNAVTSAGYGTRYTCAIAAYKRLGGSVAGGGSLPPGETTTGTSSQTGTVLALVAATVAACTQVTMVTPKMAETKAFPIPRSLIGRPCVDCAPGYTPAIVATNPLSWISGWTNPADVPGYANACVVAGTKVGDSPFLEGLPGVAGEVVDETVGAAVRALGDALGEAAFTVIVLGGIVALLLLGIWRTVK